MRIEYELKFRDYLVFNVFHQLLSIPVQLFYGGMAVFISIASRSEESILVSAIMALLAFIAMWSIQIIFNVVYLCFGSYRSLLTKHTIEIHEHAFLDETKFSRSYHFWPGITKIVSRIDFVAVYINTSAAHIIPSRAFPSPKAREEFVSILRAKAHGT